MKKVEIPVSSGSVVGKNRPEGAIGGVVRRTKVRTEENEVKGVLSVSSENSFIFNV